MPERLPLAKRSPGTQQRSSPLTSRRGDAEEAMPQLVLVSVVAHGAEVVVGTLGTLPADAEDGLLPAGVAHGALVLDA